MPALRLACFEAKLVEDYATFDDVASGNFCSDVEAGLQADEGMVAVAGWGWGWGWLESEVSDESESEGLD